MHFLYNTFVSDAYSEASQTSKMDSSTKTVNDLKPLTIFAKPSVLDVWQDSEYAPSFKDCYKTGRNSCALEFFHFTKSVNVKPLWRVS